MKQTQIQQQKKRKWLEPVIHGIFLILGLITVGFVLLISIYLIVSGIPAIRKIGLIPFLFGRRWESTASEPSFGILPFILTSIYGTAGAVCLGVPVGFFTAVYLAKCASPRVRTVMQSAIGILTGIPSVVYGLVGMLVLVSVSTPWHAASRWCADAGDHEPSHRYADDTREFENRPAELPGRRLWIGRREMARHPHAAAEAR